MVAIFSFIFTLVNNILFWWDCWGTWCYHQGVSNRKDLTLYISHVSSTFTTIDHHKIETPNKTCCNLIGNLIVTCVWGVWQATCTPSLTVWYHNPRTQSLCRSLELKSKELGTQIERAHNPELTPIRDVASSRLVFWQTQASALLGRRPKNG